MRRAARIQSAIELVDDVEASLATRGVAADRLIDVYFRSRRYAGAGDRREIIRLVYGVIRNRGLLIWSLDLKDGQRPSGRQLVLAFLAAVEHETDATITNDFSGGRFAPAPLSASERRLMDRLSHEDSMANAPLWARYNVPEWLVAPLEESLGERLNEELEALGGRASVDLRVNSLKADRNGVQVDLAKAEIETEACPFSPVGLRLTGTGRVTDLPSYRDGLFEIQDEAAQVASLLAEPERGMTVVDLCAGAGGKTLALAARMGNSGTIHAYDVDRARLEELDRRSRRAGVTIAYARTLPDSADRAKVLDGIVGSADRVVLDVPCSGTGTWRRNPEGRWRLTPDLLDANCERQKALLKEGAVLVKPGGRLIYMTCSILKRENADNADDFLTANPAFRAVDYRAVWQKAIGPEPAESASGEAPYLTLTPARHGTDGFFVAVFERKIP